MRVSGGTKISLSTGLNSLVVNVVTDSFDPVPENTILYTPEEKPILWNTGDEVGYLLYTEA